MTARTRKFNPGFLEDADIISSFCVRMNEYESIIGNLREMPASIGSHTLVIGPRGSGKTHLLLRVAAQVRLEAESLNILPIVFAEESYEVTSCGEFWLECLRHLAEQSGGDWSERLRRSHDDFARESDDELLALKSLGALLDFAEEHDQRLLLVVENLNMLFEDMTDYDAGWRIRKTLQTEPRILLLCSATGRFDEIDSRDHALFDFFEVMTLRPLDTADCQRLWEMVTGANSSNREIRPLEILTGGNPRLLTIVARFGGGRSVRDLLENLLDLVDEHTEYFKSHLDTLPPQERRVYLALARLWKPASAKEVSELARLSSSKCSALLNRLASRGRVSMAKEGPRRNSYMLSERLYNIYYLLRRSSKKDSMVTALIEFMASFYSPSELGSTLEKLYEDLRLDAAIPTSTASRLASAMLARAEFSAERGARSEAIELYDEILRQLDGDPAPGLEFALATALSNKHALEMVENGPLEAFEMIESLARRLMEDSRAVAALPAARACSLAGLMMASLGFPDAAAGAFRIALDRIGSVQRTPGIDALIWRLKTELASAYFDLGDMERAELEIEGAFADAQNVGGQSAIETLMNGCAANWVLKIAHLDASGDMIGEREFNLLLEFLAEAQSMPSNTVQAIILYANRRGADKTLELIASSEANRRLTPLLAALRCEDGRSARHSPEIEAVAEDVRSEMRRLRDESLRSKAPLLPANQFDKLT